ncbi:MAG: sulfatase-like hydrolase/transferase [Planctomycetota bacterium]
MILIPLLLSLSPQAIDVPDGLLGGARPENFAVLLVDDWGLDMLEIYGTADLSDQCITRPPTPNIDALIDSGVTFLNGWVHPVCSPTRASLLTGRMAYRHKLGRVVDQECSFAGSGCPTPDALSDSEFTIPEMLREAWQVGLAPRYGSAALGKWHLGPDPVAPLIQGFDRFRGSQHNIARADNPTETYCNWLKNSDGAFSMSQTYATTDSVDEALAFIADQGSEPWFLYMAFHAGHAPWHMPPAHLAPSYFIADGAGGAFHAQEPSCPVRPGTCPPQVFPLPPCSPACDLPLTEPLLDQVAAKRPYYEAMIEALDTEIGRLLAGIDLTTTTIFLLGDNGTPGSVTSRPFLGDRTLGLPPKSKGSIFQGGVNVPFIVAGAGVRGSRAGRGPRTSKQLVHVVDIYATIADFVGIDEDVLAAISPNELDSKSFRDILSRKRSQGRTTMLCEGFAPNFPNSADPCQFSIQRAIRNRRYKLMRSSNLFDCTAPDIEQMYDLSIDPYEFNDLIASGAHLTAGTVQQQYLRLKAELDATPLP